MSHLFWRRACVIVYVVDASRVICAPTGGVHGYKYDRTVLAYFIAIFRKYLLEICKTNDIPIVNKRMQVQGSLPLQLSSGCVQHRRCLGLAPFTKGGNQHRTISPLDK